MDNYGRNMYGYGMSNNMYGTQYFHNTPSWGYIIFYLVVLVVGVVGNAIFCLVVKKNPPLQRTIHYFLMSISIMDIIVCLTVIPFLIDSQAKRYGMWELSDILCKIYVCIDFSMKGVHAFTVFIAAIFLYFHYRKNESYATETGEIVRRKSRMHKWGLPLAWVVGVGVSAPAGAMATMFGGTCSAWHEYNQMAGTNYILNLVFVISTFVVPAVLLLFPLIALTMQVCGGRSPRLDPPHNRTAYTAILYIVVFIGLRAPHDIYELMKMGGSRYGNKGDPNRGLPPQWRSPETQLALDCLLYLPCLLHPIILVAVNPDYRQGLKNVWRNLYCNKDPRDRGGNAEPVRTEPKKKYPPAQPIIKPRSSRGGGRASAYGGDQLIAEVQPMIMPAQYNHHHHQQQQQPLLNQMGRKVQQQQSYLGAGAPYIPMQQFSSRHEPLMDNSFEMEHSPQQILPPKFQYGQLTYIDTAREEPKIAYTPTNTPPKTPQMPHFDNTPFKQPNYVEGTWILPQDHEAYRGLMPAHQIPIEGYAMPADMASSSGPVEVDEEDLPMEIESLENSPGNTLRTARRGRPEVTDLNSSPGARRRAAGAVEATARLESAPPRTPTKLEAAPPRTNGHQHRSAGSSNGLDTSFSSSTTDRPPSRVEVTLTGRSRSRQDLCPDRPRSKFEHAV